MHRIKVVSPIDELRCLLQSTRKFLKIYLQSRERVYGDN